ncbi:MAG: TIGR00730 family Rossman fold protein, partial [Flavobacteriaceae bacterium]
MMTKGNLKKWSEVKANDSWALFKIMSEFVEGYETMSAIGPCISIFGSARTLPTHPTYQLTEQIAKAVVELGYGVISGGGPGIMEAANKGAK